MSSEISIMVSNQQSISGRIIKTCNTIKESKIHSSHTPLNALNNGIYILKMTSDKQTFVKRFVVSDN